VRQRDAMQAALAAQAAERARLAQQIDAQQHEIERRELALVACIAVAALESSAKGRAAAMSRITGPAVAGVHRFPARSFQLTFSSA
jgi:hypothetical protein